jgi:hypothetical protein
MPALCRGASPCAPYIPHWQHAITQGAHGGAPLHNVRVCTGHPLRLMQDAFRIEET